MAVVIDQHDRRSHAVHQFDPQIRLWRPFPLSTVETHGLGQVSGQALAADDFVPVQRRRMSTTVHPEHDHFFALAEELRAAHIATTVGDQELLVESTACDERIVEMLVAVHPFPLAQFHDQSGPRVEPMPVAQIVEYRFRRARAHLVAEGHRNLGKIDALNLHEPGVNELLEGLERLTPSQLAAGSPVEAGDDVVVEKSIHGAP